MITLRIKYVLFGVELLSWHLAIRIAKQEWERKTHISKNINKCIKEYFLSHTSACASTHLKLQLWKSSTIAKLERWHIPVIPRGSDFCTGICNIAHLQTPHESTFQIFDNWTNWLYIYIIFINDYFDDRAYLKSQPNFRVALNYADGADRLIEKFRF